MIIDFDKRNGGGGGSGYTLPVASSSVLGGIKVGQNMQIDSAGTLTANVDLSNYATQDELSGYVETSAMSGYATTDSLSAYTPSSAMSDYLTVSDYHDDVDDVLENGTKSLYADDDPVGLVVRYNDGIDKAKVFKVTSGGTSVDDYTYYTPNRNTKAPQPEGWVVDKSEQIATIDNTNWDNPTIALKGDVAKFGYVDEEEGVANFLVSYDQQLWQQTFTREYDPEKGEDVWVDGGVQPIGGEEIEKASFTNWGTMKVGNGLGLEVDSENGAVYGISAGDNMVYGSSEGVEIDMRSVNPSAYTQYNIDFGNDYELECYSVVIKNLDLGSSNGNVVYVGNYNGKFFRLYMDNDDINVECSITNNNNRAPVQSTSSVTLNLNGKGIKSLKFTLIDEGNGKELKVYEGYDLYENEIASIQDIDFECTDFIRLFDGGYEMSDTGIGTIVIDDTNYIKPYWEIDEETNNATNIGFVAQINNIYAPW